MCFPCWGSFATQIATRRHGNRRNNPVRGQSKPVNLPLCDRRRFSQRSSGRCYHIHACAALPAAMGSAGLAVDGTGGCSASGYPPITSPSPPRSPSVRPLVEAIGRENESRASVESLRATCFDPALQCDSPQHLVVRDRAQAGRGHAGRWGSPFRPGRAGGYVLGLRVAVYGRWSSWHSSSSLVKVSPTSVAPRPWRAEHLPGGVAYG
jgi:hypothetical protein